MRRDNSLSRFRRVFVSIKPRSSRRAAWLFCNYIRPWRRRRLLRDSYAGAFHFTFPGARALSGWRGADHERARRGRFSRCTASCAAGIFPNARTFRAPFPSRASRARPTCGMARFSAASRRALRSTAGVVRHFLWPYVEPLLSIFGSASSLFSAVSTLISTGSLESACRGLQNR